MRPGTDFIAPTLLIETGKQVVVGLPIYTWRRNCVSAVVANGLVSAELFRTYVWRGRAPVRALDARRLGPDLVAFDLSRGGRRVLGIVHFFSGNAGEDDRFTVGEFGDER